MPDNFFWALNQNSGGTGGLVQGDWITPETAKLNIIASVVPSPTDLLLAANATTNSTSSNTTNSTGNSTGNSTNQTNTNNSCKITYSS